MRDMLVLIAVLAFIPMAFRSTYAAYLLWGWAGLVSLNSYVYGFMVAAPLVQLFALITLGLLYTSKGTEKRKFQPDRTSVLFIVFLVHGLFCALFAYPDLPRNWELYTNVVKIVIFCLFMPILVTNRTRMHALLVMIGLGISFHGVVDGLKFLASGGGHRAIGIAKFGDNNHFGMVLVMVIPILYYLLQYSASRLARIGFLTVLILTLLAGVATNSRGALLGMGVLAIWITLNSRRKLFGALVIGVSAMLVVALAPASWSERMNTLKSADEDASFMGRVTAWKVSSAIAVANPVFGGGFRAVQSPPVWDRFKFSPGLLGFVDTPMLNRSGVAAHSIWFEVMGDLGLVGLGIFVALLVNAFIIRSHIKKITRNKNLNLQWAGDLADLLAGSMVVYICSGSALSAAYFELPYIIMMMLEVLKIQVQAVAGRSAIEAGARRDV